MNFYCFEMTYRYSTTILVNYAENEVSIFFFFSGRIDFQIKSPA